VYVCACTCGDCVRVLKKWIHFMIVCEFVCLCLHGLFFKLAQHTATHCNTLQQCVSVCALGYKDLVLFFKWVDCDSLVKVCVCVRVHVRMRVRVRVCVF